MSFLEWVLQVDPLPPLLLPAIFLGQTPLRAGSVSNLKPLKTPPTETSRKNRLETSGGGMVIIDPPRRSHSPFVNVAVPQGTPHKEVQPCQKNLNPRSHYSPILLTGNSMICDTKSFTCLAGSFLKTFSYSYPRRKTLSNSIVCPKSNPFTFTHNSESQPSCENSPITTVPTGKNLTGGSIKVPANAINRPALQFVTKKEYKTADCHGRVTRNSLNSGENTFN